MYLGIQAAGPCETWRSGSSHQVPRTASAATSSAGRMGGAGRVLKRARAGVGWAIGAVHDCPPSMHHQGRHVSLQPMVCHHLPDSRGRGWSWPRPQRAPGVHFASRRSTTRSTTQSHCLLLGLLGDANQRRPHPEEAAVPQPSAM